MMRIDADVLPVSWDDRTFGRSLLYAAAAGTLTMVLLGLITLGLVALLGRNNMGGLAAADVFQNGWAATIVLAIVWVPFWETLVAQLLPIALLTSLGARPPVAIVTSAALFSAGHVANGGGLAQGIVTFAAGLVFAGLFVANRKHGLGRAYAITATAHAANNGAALLLSYFFGSYFS